MSAAAAASLDLDAIVETEYTHYFLPFRFSIFCVSIVYTWSLSPAVWEFLWSVLSHLLLAHCFWFYSMTLNSRDSIMCVLDTLAEFRYSIWTFNFVYLFTDNIIISIGELQPIWFLSQSFFLLQKVFVKYERPIAEQIIILKFFR